MLTSVLLLYPTPLPLHAQAQLDQLRQDLALKQHDYKQLYEFNEQTQAKGLDTETRLQGIIEELQRTSVTGLEQQETDAAAHAQATLVYQKEQLLALNRQLEELRKQAATTEEAARAATQALEEEVRQQREATEAYRAEAQQLRWEREQEQQEQQQQQETAAADATEAAVGVTFPPPFSPTPVGGSGADVERLTQAMAASEAAKDALEGELRQQQQAAEWYQAEMERLQQEQSRDEEGQGAAAAAVSEAGQGGEEEAAARQALEEQVHQLQGTVKWYQAEMERLQQSQAEGQGVAVTAPEGSQGGEEEAAARRALEEQLHQQQQEVEWYRAEMERLQQSQTEGQGATVTAPEGGQGGEEEAAARRALEEALRQQQDAAAWLQAEVEQLRRERDERQASGAAAPADASHGEEGEGMVQVLEGEIQRQRELLEGYEAELEQLRQKKASMAAAAEMSTALVTSAPQAAPVAGREDGEAEGHMVSLQPVGDEERQTLEATIRALEEANRQLVEGFQKVEARLARVNEVSRFKWWCGGFLCIYMYLCLILQIEPVTNTFFLHSSPTARDREAGPAAVGG